MKPNQTESNRNQSTQNKTVYITEYITLQYTTQYNKHNDPNTENAIKTEGNEPKKPYRNEIKPNQIKPTLQYNKQKQILNFTRIRNLMTLQTFNAPRTPHNT